jgi:outer membrane protein OmpA-like peptidoglycan-associated protein
MSTSASRLGAGAAALALVLTLISGATGSAQTQLRGDVRQLRGEPRQLRGDRRTLDGDARGLTGRARTLSGRVRRLVGRIEQLRPEPHPRPERTVFHRVIQFQFGKHRMVRDSRRKLSNLAQRLTGRTVRRIRVWGHADAIGPGVFNLGLSFRRAERACRYLTRRLEPPRRDCELLPYGERSPVARNRLRDGSDNPDGRKLNRRAKLVVIAGPR